jgi:hypothetical protein
MILQRPRRKTTFGKTIGPLTFASASALLLLGCTAPPGQFIIVQNQVPEAGCLIPSTVGTEYRSSGRLDVALVRDLATTAYRVFPVMQNNLPAPMGGQAGDPNRIALQEFEIDVGLPDDAPEGAIKDLFKTLATSGPNGGPDALIHYRVLTSGSVASGGGYTSSGLDGVPAELARRIRLTHVLESTEFIYLTTTIRAVGKTTMKTVTSDPFVYPIKVCQECLLGHVDTCPFAQAAQDQGNPCNIAQDDVVDCCIGGNGLVCPPTVMTK